MRVYRARSYYAAKLIENNCQFKENISDKVSISFGTAAGIAAGGSKWGTDRAWRVHVQGRPGYTYWTLNVRETIYGPSYIRAKQFAKTVAEKLK